MAFYDSTKRGLTAAVIPTTAPSIVWSVPGMAFYGAPVVEHNNSVFTTRGSNAVTPTDPDPEIVSLSLTDGSENWAVTLPATGENVPGWEVPSTAMRMSYVLGVTSQSKVICSRGPKIYPDYIYALDGTDGSIIWTSEIAKNMGPTGENPHSGFHICINGDIVCYNYDIGLLVRLSGDDGTIVWTSAIDNLRGLQSMQIAEHPTDETIFVATVGVAQELQDPPKLGTRIYAIDPDDGSLAQSYFVGHYYNGFDDENGSAWSPGDLCVTADSITMMSFYTLGGICPNSIYYFKWVDRDTPITLNWSTSMGFWTGYKTRHFRDVDGNVAFMQPGPAAQERAKVAELGAPNYETLGEIPTIKSAEEPAIEVLSHVSIRNSLGEELVQHPCGILRTPGNYGVEFTGLRMISDNAGTKLIHAKNGIDNRIQAFIPNVKTPIWTIQGAGVNALISEWSEICMANDNSILVNGGGHVTCYAVGGTGPGAPIEVTP